MDWAARGLPVVSGGSSSDVGVSTGEDVRDWRSGESGGVVVERRAKSANLGVGLPFL